MQTTLTRFLPGSRDEPFLVEDSEDELDVITAVSETVNNSPTPSDRTPIDRASSSRTLRANDSEASETPKATRSGSKPEKRKFRQLKLTSDGRTEKKARLDRGDGSQVVINTRKVSVEAARRRWFYRHKHLFTPLLPEKNHFLTNLEKEVNGSTDVGSYVPMKELEEQPKLVKGGEMKSYQLHGLSYLTYMYNNGMNCILGDEMGLGKTLQTLSLLAYIKENTHGTVEPHLIVCPLSVLSSWLGEAQRWLPSFKTLRFHGQQAERNRLKEEIRQGKLTFDICVTTYETYSAEDSWFKHRRWTYLVLDEGHKIKNSETQIAKDLQHLGSLYRLILTGTPIQNNLIELWSLLRWLYPSVFTPSTERVFKDAFDLTKGSYSTPILNAAHKLLSTIMLRRTKATVDSEISVPKREELTVFLPMTEAQRFWTYRMLLKLDNVQLSGIFQNDGTKSPVKGQGDDGLNPEECDMSMNVDEVYEAPGSQNQSKWKKLMNLLLQLRKICDHPYLLPNAEPEPYAIGEHIIAASSKLIAVDKLLADILPKGERVLIFSQWTSMLDLLEDFMAVRKIQYARLDGSTPRARRTLLIKLFQQERSQLQVFLISTKAGGLGINLTKASTVIMFDSDWNPQNDLQAIARAHRIGQTKTVKVYRLVCQGSVEDQMLDRLRRKLFLSVKIMGSSNSGTNDETSTLGTSELMEILRKGSSALSNSDIGLSLNDFLNAPIEKILEASRDRDSARDAKIEQDLDDQPKLEDNGKGKSREELLREAEEEEKRLLAGVAQVQSRLFEGRVVQQHRNANNAEIANEWQELQKRARYDRIVMVNGMEVIAANIGPQCITAETQQPPAKRKRVTFEHEDWCIYCRDGGELVMCPTCPRVFHGKCRGYTKAEVARMPTISCGQHNCAQCQRNTSDAGGMLFRCQTCPQSFCEDCVMWDDIELAGPTIPQFLVCDYGERDNAWYIRCQDCLERFEEDPELWKEWVKDIKEAELELKAKAKATKRT